MNTFKNHPEYKKMDVKKQQMIELLAETLQGKKLTEALPALMSWREQMNRENISFTKEENDMLTEIFISQLTPAQKKQYEFLKPFIH